MSDENPRPRGGSKKGRTFQRVTRPPGDELRRHDMWLLTSDHDFLRHLGGGNASHGLRKLITAARSMTPSP